MDLTMFRDFGYQVIHDILPPNLIAKLLLFIKHEEGLAIAQAMKEIPCSDWELLVEKAEQLADRPDAAAQISFETKRIVSGFIRLEARLSEVFYEIPRNNSIRGILKELLPCEHLRLQMPPSVRFVRPGNTLGFIGAHQDFSYNSHLKRFVVLWIPLVPVDNTCGGVAVYHGTGSMPELLPDHQVTRWIYKQTVNLENNKPIALNMVPGDILLLNEFIVHESVPNVSDRTRYSISMRFFGDDFEPTKHYLDLDSWQMITPCT
jgi:hypothetical protein